MGYIVNCIRTKPFVRIKAIFRVHKIRNRQIILYNASLSGNNEFKGLRMFVDTNLKECYYLANYLNVVVGQG